MLPYLFTGIVVVIVYVRIRSRSERTKKPRVYANPKMKKELLDNCQLLNKVYFPPPWCESGIMQTIIRSIIKTKPQLPYRREILSMKDGGEIGLDWLPNLDENQTRPVVVILPGLTGCSRDSYILHLALQLQNENNYTTVVFNNRGCGGVPFKTRQMYSAAYTDDLEAVLAHIKTMYSDVPLFAIGFSMGGMVLFNFLAKCGQRNTSPGLTAAMIISSPWNAQASTISLEGLWPKLLFNRRLVGNLKNAISRSQHLFEGVVNLENVFRSRTIAEFDTHFVVPLFGYANLHAYYQDATICHKVGDIQIPTLCLNAADDCFAPLESIPFDAIQKSQHVSAIVTSHGGHVAFLSHHMWPNGPGFAEQLACEFLRFINY